MNATVTLHPRPLLLAGAAGVLAAALAYSAVVTPWLALLIREPPQEDWLNASNGLQRYVSVLKQSLIFSSIYSPFLIGLAAFVERKGPRPLHLWLLLAMAGVSPLAFLAVMLANSGFDCAFNCDWSLLRDLVVAGSVLGAGAAGAMAAWLVRHGGRSVAR